MPGSNSPGTSDGSMSCWSNESRRRGFPHQPHSTMQVTQRGCVVLPAPPCEPHKIKVFALPAQKRCQVLACGISVRKPAAMKVGFNSSLEWPPAFSAWFQKLSRAPLSPQLEKEEPKLGRVGTSLRARLTRPAKDRGLAGRTAAMPPHPQSHRPENPASHS